MRDFKGMKRQRGRNRNGGGGKPQHNTNRAFDSNGPDGVKVRGAAQHVYEKYQQLARDAHTAGDRVLAENHLQHAEHYFRVMRAMQPQRPLADIVGRDQFVSGYDIDFEDESGGEAMAARPKAKRPWRTATIARANARARRSRTRRERYSERPPSRNDRGSRAIATRTTGTPTIALQNQQNDRAPAASATSARGSTATSGRATSVRTGASATRLGPSEPETAPADTQAPILRADDGDVSHAPAFLQVRPSEPREEGAGEPRRPRRRRAPRDFDASEPSPQVTDADEG